MKIIDNCAKCLFDKQKNRVKSYETKEQEIYLEQIDRMLKNRDENISAPHMVYLFNQIYKEQFGVENDFAAVKKEYNDLVLSMEADLWENIQKSTKEEPLLRALLYARVGNYIDFGAMNHVDKDTFLNMFTQIEATEADLQTYAQLKSDLRGAKTLLLLTDNCGEIVLDKLFIRRLKLDFPEIDISVMVRGEEALNDATLEDALYVGLDKEARVIPNGNGVTGTVYELLSMEAKEAYDQADIIFSKGQGNYESLAGCEREIYYSFLCKCDLFIKRFGVEPFTGIFVRSIQ